MTITYLLYLIGHNNPINAATHPSRRFCSLRAYASWLHQSMTGLPRFGLSNGCKVIPFADFRRSPHQIPVSLEHPPPFERHGRARAAAGYKYADMLLRGSTVGSDAEIIAKSHCTQDLT